MKPSTGAAVRNHRIAVRDRPESLSAFKWNACPPSPESAVERTIAWLNRCRRLAKDWENLNRKALAFLRLASIRLMLRKLCNPA
jgi:hypothetical protein